MLSISAIQNEVCDVFAQLRRTNGEQGTEVRSR